jgi:hypothetical protein
VKHRNLAFAATIVGTMMTGPMAHAAVSPSLETGVQANAASEETTGRPDVQFKLPGHTDERSEGVANEQQAWLIVPVCGWVWTPFGFVYQCY